MFVYLDESGDLGWILDKPYGNGGSSQYFTLAFLIVKAEERKYPKRIIRKFRKHYGISTSREIKGCDLSDNQIQKFASDTIILLDAHPNILVKTITVLKRNVQTHIRQDANKLYNYMANLCLLPFIENEPSIHFTPDPRSIKVASGNSMFDYLQTQLWFHRGSDTVLVHNPHESHLSLNIQFIDVISHVVWSSYEFNEKEPRRILKPRLGVRRLYFRN